MSERREIKGVWWASSNPEERWPGTLVLEWDKTPKVTISVPRNLGLPAPDFGQILHGCDQQGNPLALLFPCENHSTLGSALTVLHYSGGAALLGLELTTLDEFRVNCLTLDLQHLYEWAEVSGFSHKPEDSTEGVWVRHQQPELQSFTVQGDLTVEIGASFHMHNGLGEKTVAEKTVIQFKSPTGFDYQSCRSLVNAVRGLLHFALPRPIYTLSIECKKEGYGQALGDTFIPTEIEIWWGINRGPAPPEPVFKWAYRFPDVKSRFGQFIRDWLQFDKGHEEALGCYFTTVYHPLPSEVKNICLAQALEAFHASRFTFKGRNKRKFAPHQKGTFMARIRHLVRRHWASLQDLIPSAKGFAEAVRDNRNFYTHHDPKLAGRALSGAALIRLNEKMQLLFQMCVLTEMGIQPDRFSRLRWQLAQKIVEYQ